MSKVDPQKWNYTSPLDQHLINENYNDFYNIIQNSGFFQEILLNYVVKRKF